VTNLSFSWFSEEGDISARLFINNLMNNKDVYSYSTNSVTRDYQKFGWPLPERWYGLDLRYNF
jgi:hypothetical protein